MTQESWVGGSERTHHSVIKGKMSMIRLLEVRGAGNRRTEGKGMKTLRNAEGICQSSGLRKPKGMRIKEEGEKAKVHASIKRRKKKGWPSRVGTLETKKKKRSNDR